MLRHLSAFLLLSVLGAAAAAQQSSTIRVDVDLVRVVCSATQHGIPVKALQKTDFIVREDSTPQEIKYFWQEADLPLTIGLVVDVSASQSGLIRNHREIIARFLKEVLRPEESPHPIYRRKEACFLSPTTHFLEEISGEGRNTATCGTAIRHCWASPASVGKQNGTFSPVADR